MRAEWAVRRQLRLDAEVCAEAGISALPSAIGGRGMGMGMGQGGLGMEMGLGLRLDSEEDCDGSQEGSDSEPSVDCVTTGAMLRHLKRSKDIVGTLRRSTANKKRKDAEAGRRVQKKAERRELQRVEENRRAVEMLAMRLAQEREEAEKQAVLQAALVRIAQTAERAAALMQAKQALRKPSIFHSAPKYAPLYKLAPEEARTPTQMHLKVVNFSEYKMAVGVTATLYADGYGVAPARFPPILPFVVPSPMEAVGLETKSGSGVGVRVVIGAGSESGAGTGIGTGAGTGIGAGADVGVGVGQSVSSRLPIPNPNPNPSSNSNPSPSPGSPRERKVRAGSGSGWATLTAAAASAAASASASASASAPTTPITTARARPTTAPSRPFANLGQKAPIPASRRGNSGDFCHIEGAARQAGVELLNRRGRAVTAASLRPDVGVGVGVATGVGAGAALLSSVDWSRDSAGDGGDGSGGEGGDTHVSEAVGLGDLLLQLSASTSSLAHPYFDPRPSPSPSPSPSPYLDPQSAPILGLKGLKGQRKGLKTRPKSGLRKK
ncbi:hypothetical protein B484DRAFT_392838 [Ochromonadaceae sp. CCMP2298]|nr:hypothetical protein B484DRAFT_392838 [Ochromonadaceae sp. CCMP2298]